MPKKPDPPESAEPKRRNRSVGIGEAVTGLLDPALKRRGFATRDIITHWAAMAPAPYDHVAMPDKLAWPRGERSAEGATLHLRCSEGHRLALVHDAPRLAAAVNRYFGYVLVKEVRLAITPFTPGSAAKPKTVPQPDPVQRALVARAVNGVADPNVREALRELGHALATKRS